MDRRVYRFEDVEVIPHLGLVRRKNRDLHLRQKTFQVLLCLLAHRDRLVTKEELIAHIWPDTAVTDGSLMHCLVDLRKALGDDPRRPRFVRTVPKMGFRFVAAVDEIPLTPPGSPEVREEPSSDVALEEVGEPRVSAPATDQMSRQVANPGTPAGSAATRWQPRRGLLLAGLVVLAAGVTAIGWFLRPARARADVTLPHVPGRPAVVVMPFHNRSNAVELDWLREGLADMLITGLTRSQELNVLSRQQLAPLLGQMSNQDDKRLSLDEALPIARRAQAEKVVLGSFATIGSKVRIDVQVHETENGRLLAGQSLTLDSAEEILTRVDLLSVKLGGDLGANASRAASMPSLAGVTTANLDAYRYYSLALQKAESLRNIEAIDLLNKAIALDPDFAMAHARIGYTYAVTWGQVDRAKPHLAKAFALPGRLTEKDRLYIAAWRAIADRDYAAAIQTLRQVIVHYPLEVEAYLRLGRLLVGEERFQEAETVLQQGLGVDRDSADLQNQLATLYNASGQHPTALEAARRYATLSPNEPNAFDALGLSYQALGMYEQASDAYMRALDLKPDFEPAIIHLGNVYLQLGRYREAVQQYERYQQVAPSEIERDRGRDAVAWVYLRRGDRAGAERALRGQRTDLPLLTALPLALDAGDFTRAVRLTEAQRPPDRGSRLTNRFATYSRGALALREGRSEEALAHFGKVLEHPAPTWSMDTYEDCLANAFLELGRLDEAIAEYERILRINPRYPLAHYHLALAYDRQQQPDRARSAYVQFLEVWKDADRDIPEVRAATERLQELSAGGVLTGQ